ncbi:MAG: hypothetical protein M1159_01760 [Candidatus Thermoplasmatota archaeon]|nr:hypothetical protein [Candidatus Thermoplasmatota archaeon]
MKVNYELIANGTQNEKRAEMEKFFNGLLKLNSEDQVESFKDLLVNLAKDTDDKKYREFCKTSLEVFLSLKNVNLQNLMAVRLEAQFELPEEDRVVDSVNLLKAIDEMPQKDFLLDLIESIEK